MRSRVVPTGNNRKRHPHFDVDYERASPKTRGPMNFAEFASKTRESHVVEKKREASTTRGPNRSLVFHVIITRLELRRSPERRRNSKRVSRWR
jgi:hypothetical protein